MQPQIYESPKINIKSIFKIFSYELLIIYENNTEELFVGIFIKVLNFFKNVQIIWIFILHYANNIIFIYFTNVNIDYL